MYYSFTHRSHSIKFYFYSITFQKEKKGEFMGYAQALVDIKKGDVKKEEKETEEEEV